MTHRVIAIPGDGIGPEVVGATRRAIDATGVDVEWREVEIGEPALRRSGSALPEDALAAISGSDATLKGPIATPANPMRARAVPPAYPCLRKISRDSA